MNTKSGIFWAVFLTTAYSAFWVTVIIKRWEDFSVLSFNEIGDFFAGTVGVLAFLWLVFAYFQQSRELKNSSDSLKAQLKEIEQSVEQQSRLANATAMALEADKNSRRETTYIAVRAKLEDASEHQYQLRNILSSLLFLMLRGAKVVPPFDSIYDVYKKDYLDAAISKADEQEKKIDALSDLIDGMELEDMNRSIMVSAIKMESEGSSFLRSVEADSRLIFENVDTTLDSSASSK